MPGCSVDVVVYDPNALNPYGAELAAVLASDGHRVTRWCRVGDPFRESGVRQRRVFWASRSQVGPIRSLFSRYWGAGLFVFNRLASPRSTVVMTWLASEIDLRIALFLIRRGQRVVYIDHNPLQARPLSGRKEALMAQVRDSSGIRVVHSEYLAAEASGTVCRVARHPSYLRWVVRYGADRPTDSQGPLALFLGALRADKGAGELPELGELLAAEGMPILIAGRGTIPGMTDEQMRKSSGLKPIGINRSLSDDEVAGSLRNSGVLLAPYRDVTMSGSIMMALSAGVPVAAYGAKALVGTIPPEFVATEDTPEALAELALKLAGEQEHWAEELRLLVEDIDLRCVRDWQSILTG